MPTQGKRTSKDRNVNTRRPRPSILIVCEGERTEPDYFRKFRVTPNVYDVYGEAMNTLSLVERTIYRRDTQGPFEQVWCVFDLDSFPKENFDKAIRLAEKENIRVAYSNEAFELWYVLHFDYLQAKIDRDRYKAILNKRLGRRYEKNDETVYDQIYSRQAIAIANAERLLEEHHEQHLAASEKKPSTTVHELVRELNKYIK